MSGQGDAKGSLFGLHVSRRWVSRAVHCWRTLMRRSVTQHGPIQSLRPHRCCQPKRPWTWLAFAWFLHCCNILRRSRRWRQLAVSSLLPYEILTRNFSAFSILWEIYVQWLWMTKFSTQWRNLRRDHLSTTMLSQAKEWELSSAWWE